MSDLGQALKDSRNNAGLSQNEVADAIHVSRQSVSKWEHNTQMPDISRVRDMCQLYGLSMDDLMDKIDAYDAANSGPVNSSVAKVTDIQTPLEDNLRLQDGQTNPKAKTTYDDSALLLILAAVCAFIPLVDLIAPWLVIWKNKKSNRYYWWINGICVLTWLVALGTYAIAYVMSDKYL